MNRSRGAFYRPLLYAAALMLSLLSGTISFSAPPGDDEHEHDNEHEGRLCRHKPENVGDPSRPGPHHVATASYNRQTLSPSRLRKAARQRLIPTCTSGLWSITPAFPRVQTRPLLPVSIPWSSIFMAITAYGSIPGAIIPAGRLPPTQSRITKATITSWSAWRATVSSPCPSTQTI